MQREAELTADFLHRVIFIQYVTEHTADALIPGERNQPAQQLSPEAVLVPGVGNEQGEFGVRRPREGRSRSEQCRQGQASLIYFSRSSGAVRYIRPEW